MKNLLILSCLISTTIAFASPKQDNLPDAKPEQKSQAGTTRIMKTDVPNYCLSESDPESKTAVEVCDKAAEEVQRDYLEELEDKGMK